MPLWAAEVFRQNLDPLGSPWLSTVVAALPVLALFVFLVPMRWLAPKAARWVWAVFAILVAIFAFHMPANKALAAMGFGMAFGLLPVGWNIFFAMFLYNITVETGQFAVIRRSVASPSPDVAGAGHSDLLLLWGDTGRSGGRRHASGNLRSDHGGSGIFSFKAAVLCLIANTSPVAYGGLGTPLIVLGDVTGISSSTLSIMAGFQLPFFRASSLSGW